MGSLSLKEKAPPSFLWPHKKKHARHARNPVFPRKCSKHLVARTLPPAYLLLRYQLKASAAVSVEMGEGTSARPGRATGWRRYTAEQTFWLTSR